MIFLPTETVLDGGAVPPPPLVARAKPQEPLRTLLASTYHVGEVAHDPVHVLLMHVRKKAVVNRGVTGIFERLTSSPSYRLDVALSIERQDGKVRELILLEALPS